jgi:curved DNA-binding protein CbpA
MPSPEAFRAWLDSVSRKSYYDLLRLPLDADAASIKAAFHDFALAYHPDRYVDDGPEVTRLAGEAFKRGVEAYRVLGRPALRARYDQGLAKGRLRFDEKAPESEPAPPPMGKTLEAVATTKKGKEHALRADRFLSIGDLEKARLELVNACQCEPDNAELADRLTLVYEALALEPL